MTSYYLRKKRNQHAARVSAAILAGLPPPPPLPVTKLPKAPRLKRAYVNLPKHKPAPDVEYKSFPSAGPGKHPSVYRIRAVIHGCALIKDASKLASQRAEADWTANILKWVLGHGDIGIVRQAEGFVIEEEALLKRKKKVWEKEEKAKAHAALIVRNQVEKAAAKAALVELTGAEREVLRAKAAEPKKRGAYAPREPNDE